MLIHLQISEAFQSVFQNDELKQRHVLDFEIRKVKEIHELIISS